MFFVCLGVSGLGHRAIQSNPHLLACLTRRGLVGARPVAGRAMLQPRFSSGAISVVADATSDSPRGNSQPSAGRNFLSGHRVEGIGYGYRV